ncbi:MAG TPA: hypothetical protein VN284_06545 [Rhizobium sp.]|uniref:hypothetical protein n=1 Tax=Rhizobium sp. F40D2 TaxID=3453141 RepID=UPI002B71DDDA|nr:hypothetical protein [Rhizobium sp.]
MNKAFDLTAAAAHLSDNPKAADFIKAVRKFQSAVSVTNDLKEAQVSVNALIAMRGDDSAQDYLIRALLMHAVVTYCRASTTKAIERYNVGVTGAYSPEQKEQHESIVFLRDRVLAHFGPGDGWHIEKVIYTEQEHGDAITAVHKRVASDSVVVDVLKELLTAAIPYVEARQAERAKELDTVLHSNQQLYKLIDRVPFDPMAFFGDTACAGEDFWGPDGFSIDSTIRTTTAERPKLWSTKPR